MTCLHQRIRRAAATMAGLTGWPAALVASVCAAALALGLLSTPAAAAVPPDARPAPNTAPRAAKPPGARVPAAVLAAKSRIRAPADQGSITVSLTASRSDGGYPLRSLPGHTITLTATTNTDVGPTPWFIEIYDYSSTTLLQVCGGGTTCSVDVTEPSPIAPGQIAFVAYVAQYGWWRSLPPDVQADTAASPVEPSWLYPMTLTAYKFGGAGVTLDFTDGGATTWAPWYIQLYDATKGQIVAWCAKPLGCNPVMPGWEGDYPNPYDAGCDCGYVGTSDGSYSSDSFYTVIAQYSATWPPPDIRDWADHPA